MRWSFPVEVTSVILDLDALVDQPGEEGLLSFTLPGARPVEFEAFRGPASYFQEIARRITQPYCILLPKNGSVHPTAMESILHAMQECGADMAIAKVKDADGIQSLLPRRLEDLRFSSLVPWGGVVFTREHFVKVAEQLPVGKWNPWWHFDLVRAGVFLGLACLADCVVTSIERRLPTLSHGETWVPLRRSLKLPPTEYEPIILVYGSIEASVSLYFDGLPPDVRGQLRFYSPRDPISDLPHLAGADGVIIVRDFEHMVTSGLLELLKAMEVPLFWFTDDHFEALRPEYPAFRYYDSEAMRVFLSGMRGIFVSTPALMEIYEKYHENVELWPLVFDETLAAPFSPDGDSSFFRIGVFGGDFRRESLSRDVMPALQLLPSSLPRQTYLRADLARGVEDPTVVPMPFDSSYRQFVYRWQRLKLNAVAHPFGSTRNIPNKSFGSILTARYLGAVPVVAAECAQKELTEEQGVLIAGKGAGAWKDALQRTQEKDERQRLFSALDSWCRNTFCPEKIRAPYSSLRAMLPAQPVDVGKRMPRALSHPRAREILFPEPACPPVKRSLWEKLLSSR